MAQSSNIQIVSEPDISIFLNGEFKGKTTSEMGGMIIENIVAGEYKIKAVKEGFVPQEKLISLKRGEVLKYYVSPSFLPSIKISQNGNTNSEQLSLKMGKLKIQSLPIEINIEIKSLNINDVKNMDEWTANPIQEGIYHAVFSWNNKSLNYDLDIKQDQETSIFVNMIKNVVENRGKGISSNESGTFTDYRDNKNYKWIKIGTQTWMAENLNYFTDGGSWSNGPQYGRYYNWKYASTVCPTGWHLPSQPEYEKLFNTLGINDQSGGSELLTDGHSGFNALPAGFRDFNARFYSVEGNSLYGGSPYFWSSTAYKCICISGGAVIHDRMKVSGCSVRCLKDN